MKLEQSFEVKAPVEEVWRTLIDIERVAPCLPGAEITGSEGDTYSGTFQVKLGPTTAAYRGKLEMQSLDEAAHVATMRASGQDKRGQGSANATMVSSLADADGGGTRVDVVTDFTITGRLARFGRGGMIQDISNRLLRDFAACLQETINVPGDASESEGSGASHAGSDVATGSTAERAADDQPGQPVPAAPRATPARPAARPAAKPVKGLSLFVSVLWERLRRLLKRS